MSTLKTNRIENLTTTDGGISIDNSGNVGLGTTAPQRALQVGAHGSGNGEIALASSTSGNCSILMGDGATGTDLYRGYIQYNNSSDAMLFATSAAERMRIDSLGNVAIGSSSVNSSRKVEITQPSGYAAGLRIMQGGSGAYNQFFSGTSNWRVGSPQLTNALTFDEGSTSTERMRIDSNGNVGIGDSSPSDKLSVSGGNIGIYNTGNSHGNLYFYKDGTAKAWVKYRGDNSRLIIGNTSDALTIDSSGKVGLNGHNPGDYNSSGNELVLGNSSSNAGMTIVSNSANNGHIFFADGTSGGALNRGIIKYEHANDAMAFNTAETERMRIQSGGGVSIGTSSSPTCLTQASALRLGNNTLGSHTITNVSTTVTNITAASGLGGLAFVQLYNTANGAQYVGLHQWRYGNLVTISETNNTGLTLNFSVSTNTLRLATASGTVSGSVITLQAST